MSNDDNVPKPKELFTIEDENTNTRTNKSYSINTTTKNNLDDVNSVDYSINTTQYDDVPDAEIVEENEEQIEEINVGICAMEKKVNSKPMMEILTRLESYNYLKIIIFKQETILNEPVEKWPQCDCLISFYSKDFPLSKVQEYAKLFNPFLINNLDKQWDIMNRVKVYETLRNAGIEQPRYAIKYHSDDKKIIEQDDQIEIDGQIFTKPFVEKPINADDHNVFIYFPSSAGGGSQRLFRKIGTRSSHYSTENRIRRNGSYIYEEFMPTDGTDVKVYTVGPEYAHAEARKSPALDGVVERDENGKEVRYPIMLSANEKLIAKKIVLAFEQSVCGFDLLRAYGKSYVCDVNGFSFVKNSSKYYADCASILAYMIIKEIAPQRHIPISISVEAETRPIVPTSYGTLMELRCIIAVIRHGDRTPKQKLKMEVKHPLFFELFEKYDGYKTGELKLKKPSQLQEVLDVARTMLKKCSDENVETLDTKETRTKLIQIKSVLEMYGHFSGINRKVQFKYQKNGKKKQKQNITSSDDDNSKIDQDDPSLLLILKWGGELTAHGRAQAEDLGTAFRKLYPSGEGNYTAGNDKSDTGFLRLHSTYRHDLKIYASDEGRVQMTAASFAKGLLALEGELAPILVQMVKSANTNGLLDNDSLSASYQNEVKQKLVGYLSENRDLVLEDFDRLAPTRNYSLKSALEFIKNPNEMCKKVLNYIRELTDLIRNKITKSKCYEKELYHSETWELMLRRWAKLEKDFYNKKTEKYEISKIPDIYDCIKYDLMHNQHILNFENGFELYMCSKALADYVVPQEYGITKEEKLRIAQGIVAPLLQKIRIDLKSNLTGIWDCEDELVNKLNPSYTKGIQTPGRHVRTRLYFTSESHVYSLLNVLKYGDLFGADNDDPQWRAAMESISAIPELNYLTQIVIMLYEDTSVDPQSDKRFHIELHFSPGAYDCLDEPNKTQPKNQDETSRTVKIPVKTSSLTRDDIHIKHKQTSNTLTSLKRFFKVDTDSNTIPENSMPVEISDSKSEKNHTIYARSDSKPRSYEEESYQQKTDPKKGSLNTYRPVSHIFNNGTNSSPDLNKFLSEKKNCKTENEAIYPELLKVRSIVPLQTLHNNLCFKNLNEFFGRMANSNDKQDSILLNCSQSHNQSSFNKTQVEEENINDLRLS